MRKSIFDRFLQIASNSYPVVITGDSICWASVPWVSCTERHSAWNRDIIWSRTLRRSAHRSWSWPGRSFPERFSHHRLLHQGETPARAERLHRAGVQQDMSLSSRTFLHITTKFLSGRNGKTRAACKPWWFLLFMNSPYFSISYTFPIHRTSWDRIVQPQQEEH